jgi:hypothetical protein
MMLPRAGAVTLTVATPPAGAGLDLQMALLRIAGVDQAPGGPDVLDRAVDVRAGRAVFEFG